MTPQHAASDLGLFCLLKWFSSKNKIKMKKYTRSPTKWKWTRPNDRGRKIIHHKWVKTSFDSDSDAILIEPRRQKTSLRDFRPGPTQTGLCNDRRWLEAYNLRFRKKSDYSIQVAKTKTQISFAVTAKLICVFVFAYAKILFSHVAAQLWNKLAKCLSTKPSIYEQFQPRSTVSH